MLQARFIRKFGCLGFTGLPSVFKVQHKHGVCMTFDDGPSLITPFVLDLLCEYKIKAIFFVVGLHFTDKDHIVNRIIEDGHILGNHTFSHREVCNLDRDEFCREVFDFQDEIDRYTGSKYRIFRPPRGLISYRQLVALKNKNINTLFWDIDSMDSWRINSHEIASKVISKVNIKKGGTVLFHDDNVENIESLKIVLRSFRDLNIPTIIPL